MARVLALDVGERRIGVAISDPLGVVARPLMTIVRRSREEDFSAVAALVAEHGVDLVVVGHPLSLNGSGGPQARSVRRYARALAAHLPVPVVLYDERFSTAAATEIIRANLTTHRHTMGKNARNARSAERARLDAVSAAVILQRYLDSLTPKEERTEP